MEGRNRRKATDSLDAKKDVPKVRSPGTPYFLRQRKTVAENDNQRTTPNPSGAGKLLKTPCLPSGHKLAPSSEGKLKKSPCMSSKFNMTPKLTLTSSKFNMTPLTSTSKKNLVRKKVIKKPNKIESRTETPAAKKQMKTNISDREALINRPKMKTPVKDEDVAGTSKGAEEAKEFHIYEEIDNVVPKIIITDDSPSLFVSSIDQSPINTDKKVEVGKISESPTVDESTVVKYLVFSPGESEVKEAEIKELNVSLPSASTSNFNENENEHSKEQENTNEEIQAGIDFISSESSEVNPVYVSDDLTLNNHIERRATSSDSSDKINKTVMDKIEPSNEQILCGEASHNIQPGSSSSKFTIKDSSMPFSYFSPPSTVGKDQLKSSTQDSQSMPVKARSKETPNMLPYYSPPVIIHKSKMSEVLIYKLGSQSTPRKIRKKKDPNSVKKNLWGTPETNFFPGYNHSSHNIIAKRSMKKSVINKYKAQKIPSALVKPVIFVNKAKGLVESNKPNNLSAEENRKLTRETYEITPVNSLIMKYESMIKGNTKGGIPAERVKIHIRRSIFNNDGEDKLKNVTLNKVNGSLTVQKDAKLSDKQTKTLNKDIKDGQSETVKNYYCKRKFSFHDEETSALSKINNDDKQAGKVYNKRAKHNNYEDFLKKNNTKCTKVAFTSKKEAMNTYSSNHGAKKLVTFSISGPINNNSFNATDTDQNQVKQVVLSENNTTDYIETDKKNLEAMNIVFTGDTKTISSDKGLTKEGSFNNTGTFLDQAEQTFDSKNISSIGSVHEVGEKQHANNFLLAKKEFSDSVQDQLKSNITGDSGVNDLENKESFSYENQVRNTFVIKSTASSSVPSNSLNETASNDCESIENGAFLKSSYFIEIKSCPKTKMEKPKIVPEDSGFSETKLSNDSTHLKSFSTPLKTASYNNLEECYEENITFNLCDDSLKFINGMEKSDITSNFLSSTKIEFNNTTTDMLPNFSNSFGLNKEKNEEIKHYVNKESKNYSDFKEDDFQSLEPPVETPSKYTETFPLQTENFKEDSIKNKMNYFEFREEDFPTLPSPCKIQEENKESLSSELNNLKEESFSEITNNVFSPTLSSQKTPETKTQYVIGEEDDKNHCKQDSNRLKLDVKENLNDPGQFLPADQDDTPTASVAVLFKVAEGLLNSPMSYTDYRKEFYKRLSLENT